MLRCQWVGIQLGESVVNKIDAPFVLTGAKEKVIRFDISVNNVMFVNVFNSIKLEGGLKNQIEELRMVSYHLARNRNQVSHRRCVGESSYRGPKELEGQVLVVLASPPSKYLRNVFMTYVILFKIISLLKREAYP